MVGNQAAIQIQETIKNIELSDSNTFAAILEFFNRCFGVLQKYKVRLFFGFLINQ
jgi:hypothetical protein